MFFATKVVKMILQIDDVINSEVSTTMFPSHNHGIFWTMGGYPLVCKLYNNCFQILFLKILHLNVT